MKKYLLVLPIGEGEYEEVDKSSSKRTIENLKKLYERTYKRKYKIITFKI